MTTKTTWANVEERFYEKVALPEDLKRCWEWIGAKGDGGYGMFRFEGKCQAHRVAWEMHNGLIPEGEGYHGVCVLHECDNPGCVNPDHLFLGTHSKNMKDKFLKKRDSNRGSRNPNVTLTKDKVRQIRKRYAEGESQSALGREFGIQQPAVWKIVTHRTWRNI